MGPIARNIVYLDFKKAFHSVPHARLLKKLHAYGIGGKLLECVSYFLRERRQCVNVDGELSSWKKVESGIPQASILGPLLFLVYVNDIPLEVKNPMKMFADDTKFYGDMTTKEEIAKLQNVLDAVARWTSAWQLPLSVKKCQLLHLGRHNVKNQYRIADIPIETVKEEKTWVSLSMTS